MMAFSNEQFNRLFPFYIRVNRQLVITAGGLSLKKICGEICGELFTEHFKVKRPFVELTDAASFLSVCGQVVVIQVKNTGSVILRGQFELLGPEGDFLFIGSPWFDSSDKVSESGLGFNDFANHDPLPDMLHLLKTQEIVNGDLKELLQTVNNQKEALKKADDELNEMAQFFMQHPDPLLRLSTSGEVILKNSAAGQLKVFLYAGEVLNAEQLWLKVVANLNNDGAGNTVEVASDGKVYSFSCRYVQGYGYYNIFGREITALKEKEEKLKILSQIAEGNVNAVIITDAAGCITWVNNSFYTITGYHLNEVLGKKPGHLLQGKNTDPEKVAYLKKQIAAKAPFTAELVNYAKNGRPYWIRVLGQPLHNSNGEHVGFFAIEEDITEEREIQERIKESEARFKLVLEKTGDNVWEHDFRTGKTYFSKSDNDILGLINTKADNYEKLWWDSIYKDDLYMVVNSDLNYRRGDASSHNLEYRIVQANGSIRWVLDRGVVIEKDADGKPLRIIGTHTDITKIKQTEAELEQRVKQFRSLSENVPGVIYEYEFNNDGTGGFRYISPAMERIFGIDPSDFSNYTNCIHPDDMKMLQEKNNYSKQTLAPFNYDCRLVIPGQGIRWHSLQSSFSYISQKGSTVFTGMMLDITERKNAEVTLRANEEKYRSIIANMNLGLLEVDNDETISYANQGFCIMSGYTFEELKGKNASSLFVQGNNAEVVKHKNQARSKGVADAYEITVTNKQGALKWWLISGAPRYNDKGELVGSIGIHLDITEQKKLEKELIEARERAENLARTKETFLANMSHEIRTPMNAIMGMGNQLLKTTLTAQQHFFLETINTASENLLVIINDILDLSKIEAGKLVIENIGFEPAALAKKTLQALAHKAEEKGLKLLAPVIDSGIAPVLVGDPNRIGQVLLNLLSNAIKFTEKGAVSMSVKLVQNNETTQKVEVVVTDTGIGMDEAFLLHLFDKFSQENESISRKYGGTGLGMSICKQLIELMGGTIYADSKKGYGTTISFCIEFKKGSITDLPKKNTVKYDSAVLKGKKVLVTDDNELNRLVASVTLEHYGAVITQALGGPDAIKKVAAQAFDIVLMDIQMPEMDGYQAARQIRVVNKNIPIIAFTAKAIKGEREKCTEAGMNDYIAKPFKEDELVKMVAQWCGLSIAETGPKKQVQANGPQPIYSLAELKGISTDNDELIEKIVDLFCEQTPQFVREMREAYDAGNLGAMGKLAHKIKSSLDYFSVVSIKDAIREIEKAGNEKNNTPALPGLLQVIEQTVLEAVRLMQQDRAGLHAAGKSPVVNAGDIV
jgi:PAS domain S-box-containing protein